MDMYAGVGSFRVLPPFASLYLSPCFHAQRTGPFNDPALSSSFAVPPVLAPRVASAMGSWSRVGGEVIAMGWGGDGVVGWGASCRGYGEMAAADSAREEATLRDRSK